MDIYVSNLNAATGDEELHGLFSQYGTVQAVFLIKDLFTNTSRGFAFIQMDDTAEATKAIQELNELIVMNEKIHVREATIKELYHYSSFLK